MLKKIGLFFAILIAILMIVPLFLPSDYSVMRSKDFVQSDSLIYSLVGDFNEFVKWSPWQERDPGATVTITGVPFTVGYKYEWKGDPDLSGSGYMEVTAVEPGKKITMNLVFNEPMQSTALNVWEFEKTPDGSRMFWTTSGELDYFGRYFGLMMDGMLGADFEHGLSTLKKYAETK